MKTSQAPTRSLAAPPAVAEYLGVPQATLTQWRYLGKGPRWRKVGRHVRYDWPSVERWLASQPGGGEAA
jgi:Helix-turn-helix domain